jgi:HEAT repeats
VVRAVSRTATGSVLGLWLMGGAMAPVTLPAAQAGEARPWTVVDVDVSRGELTVDVHDAPLPELLRTVGEKAGIALTFRGDVDAVVTESFSGVPLEEGIRRLARGHSVTAAYAVSTDAPTREVLTAIWVVGRATGADSARASAITRGPQPPSSGEDSRSATADPVVARIGEIRTLADEAGRGDQAAAVRLADVSVSEPEVRVREQAVAALARIKGPLVEPALTVALDDAAVSVRMRAVRGLRGTGTDTAVASLARASTDDTDPEVRLAALSALVSFPGHTMVQGLVRAAADPDRRVRDAAFRGLTWWNARGSGAP